METEGVITIQGYIERLREIVTNDRKSAIFHLSVNGRRYLVDGTKCKNTDPKIFCAQGSMVEVTGKIEYWEYTNTMGEKKRLEHVNATEIKTIITKKHK